MNTVEIRTALINNGFSVVKNFGNDVFQAPHKDGSVVVILSDETFRWLYLNHNGKVYLADCKATLDVTFKDDCTIEAY